MLAFHVIESNLFYSTLQNLHPDSSDVKLRLQIQELERQIHELKQDLDQKTYLAERLQFEAKAKLLREESTRNRNNAMLDVIKQKYFFDTPGLEPVLATIIEAYEDRLAQPQPLLIKQYKDTAGDLTENESIVSPSKVGIIEVCA